MTTIQLKLGYIARKQYLSFAAFSWRGVIAFVLGLITLSLCMVILAVRTGAVVSSNLASPADPFAGYRSIMSGQPITALEEHLCLEPAPRPPVPMCDIHPVDGLFYLISVSTTAGRITQLSFFFDTLQLGDLIHQWGEPDSMRRSTNGRVISLVWETRIHQYEAAILLRDAQPHVRHVTMRIMS